MLAVVPPILCGATIVTIGIALHITSIPTKIRSGKWVTIILLFAGAVGNLYLALSLAG